MSNLYVIVGLIGVGKTTLAKSLPDTRHISFDDEWHGKLQLAGAHPLAAVDHFAKLVNGSNYPHVAIDGWWTWHEHVHEVVCDRTLHDLDARTPHHTLRLIHLTMPLDRALAEFHKKHQSFSMQDYPSYIEQRHNHLQGLVDSWARSSASSTPSR